MSTHFTDIRAALDSHLSQLPGVPAIAWENVEYNRAGQLYLGAFLLPAATVQATLGTQGRELHNGIYQVSVNNPKANGQTPWPDVIADHFKRGTTIIQGEVALRIISVSIAPGFEDKPFYVTPISIRYQTFTPARF